MQSVLLLHFHYVPNVSNSHFWYSSGAYMQFIYSMEWACSSWEGNIMGWTFCMTLRWLTFSGLFAMRYKLQTYTPVHVYMSFRVPHHWEVCNPEGLFVEWLVVGDGRWLLLSTPLHQKCSWRKWGWGCWTLRCSFTRLYVCLSPPRITISLELTRMNATRLWSASLLGGLHVCIRLDVIFNHYQNVDSKLEVAAWGSWLDSFDKRMRICSHQLWTRTIIWNSYSWESKILKRCTLGVS